MAAFKPRWLQIHLASPGARNPLPIRVLQSLTCNVTNSDIIAGFKTDHSLITIKLSLHSNRRSPGFWKLNTSLLEEDGYVKQIKTAIKAVQEEYQAKGATSSGGPVRFPVQTSQHNRM